MDKLIIAWMAIVAFLAPVSGASAQPNSLYSEQPPFFSDLEAAPGSITVAGVTQYNPNHLLSFALAHLNQSQGGFTATGLADSIALIYREDGYPLAEASFTFESASQSLTFQVDEGFVRDVTVEGLSPRSAERAASYLAPLIGVRPVRESDLERAVMLVSDMAGVTAYTSLDHGPDQSGAHLILHGSDRRSSGAVGMDVIPLRPGSAVRAFLLQEFYSLASGGDTLRLVGQASLDRGDDWSVTGYALYRSPIGSAGSYVEAYGGNTIARRDFGAVQSDERLRGYNAALAFGHPFHRDVHGFAYLVGEYEFLEARSRFGGQRLSSTTQSLRAHLVAGRHLANGGIVQGSLTLSGGIRPETDPGEMADGSRTFAHIRGAAGWITAIGSQARTYFRFETRGQVATTRLPEVERFALGHAPFLRGYAPAEIEGDSGIGASLELDHLIEFDGGLRSITPQLFFDFGYVHARGVRTGEYASQTLSSVGLGTEVHVGSATRIAGWAAIPLNDGPQSRAGNPAFHISIVQGW